MTALRWILLLAGLLFIAALAVWEMRRQRQASGSRTVRTEPVVEEPAESLPLPALAPRHSEAQRALPVIQWPPASAAADDEPPADAPAPSAPQPVVDWPPEGMRRICNLRLVPGRDQRIAGRNLRQSLLATGFVHGEFGIFHLSGIGNRVLVSAANLARPGMLDPDNMDYQRFSGINLFTVLPAGVPDHEALDVLFAVSQRLAERLGARLQDGEGRTLDAGALAALRRTMLDGRDAAAAAGG